MTDPELIELAEDLIRHGCGSGMTMDEALSLCERLILEATLVNHFGNCAAAARAMGRTREYVYQARRRHGLPIAPARTGEIPGDWRERLAL